MDRSEARAHWYRKRQRDTTFEPWNNSDWDDPKDEENSSNEDDLDAAVLQNGDGNQPNCASPGLGCHAGVSVQDNRMQDQALTLCGTISPKNDEIAGNCEQASCDVETKRKRKDMEEEEEEESHFELHFDGGNEQIFQFDNEDHNVYVGNVNEEQEGNPQDMDLNASGSDQEGSQSGNSRHSADDSENEVNGDGACDEDNQAEEPNEDNASEEEYHEEEVNEEGLVTDEDESENDLDEDEADEDLAQDGDDNGDPDDELIYNGARITFQQSLLSILTFVITHKITGLAVSDLLALIELHCGANNLCIKTNYKFRKYFHMIGKRLITCCYYCSNCQVPLPRHDSICGMCNGQHDIAYFIQFPIIDQLKTFFSRPEFFESLQFRFNRNKKHEANLEDIYDASIYQEQVDNGFLANPNNISFFGYFDGMSLFKKSTFSIWPLYLSINELKYSQRTKKENVILAGIWFGKSKPNPNLFLQPVSQALNNLENNGVPITLPNGNNINVKAKLIGAVADMPAKSTFMRLKQFNGAFSCFYCLDEGARFDLGNRNHTSLQVFPYSRNIQLRNGDNMNEFAQQAVIARQVDPKAAVYGVKGPSLLLNMLSNIIFSMGADIMHGVFLGVQKTLMHLWFDPQYSGLPFSISDMTGIVDQRLKSIKPPKSLNKLPKSIKTEFAQMKAADYKIFFFYYSLPALKGILPDNYWFHHCKLVSAITLLCKGSVSQNDMDKAKELLHSYVSEFADLYGLRYLTLTFHQLLHFPEVVRHLGPMWVYSCFFYESLNGQFAQLVHGSRHAALQIASSCSIVMNLPVMISSMNACLAKDLCLRFQATLKNIVSVTEPINNSIGVVGKYKADPVPGLIRRLVENSFDVVGGRFWYFTRLKINSIVFSSESYHRSKRTLSCFANIFHDDTPYLCKIMSFLKWSSCQDVCPVPCDNNCQTMFLCIAQVYERLPWKLHEAPDHPPIFHLNRVENTNTTRAFSVHCIKEPCLFMKYNREEYLSLPLNNLEVE